MGSSYKNVHFVSFKRFLFVKEHMGQAMWGWECVCVGGVKEVVEVLQQVLLEVRVRVREGALVCAQMRGTPSRLVRNTSC